MGRNLKATLPPELAHLYQSRFYKIWANMKSRCNNPKLAGHKDYGGRGISYAPSWHTFMGFYEDMFEGYDDMLMLERRDNDKGYSKANCYWATRLQQNNNTRRNKFVTIRGETKTLAQWVREFGLKSSTVRQRYYVLKWPIEEALEVASHRY